MPQLRLHVSGVVQGVGYRYFIQDLAQELNLTGYAQNRPDGSVEVIAEGDKDKLELLLVAAKKGPRSGQVENVETEWSEADRKWYSFEVE
jgi:acylphosphatase